MLYGMAWRYPLAFPGPPRLPGCEGKTWLTQDLSTGALWAVKMVRLPLHTKMVQAIFREIRIQAELGEGHINIITPQVGGGGSGRGGCCMCEIVGGCARAASKSSRRRWGQRAEGSGRKGICGAGRLDVGCRGRRGGAHRCHQCPCSLCHVAPRAHGQGGSCSDGN